ncbi:phage replication O-like protein O [Klebsiella sp. BIGb0407]|nr:replication protein [Klebsiella sp. BIGb0407]MCS3430056.1 phage replication O-like protein O [Klebsiella sp. BIGb0407]
MSNVAEIIKFPASERAQRESNMADLESGYLRLANQIQDALCIVELSGREFRVLNSIVRLTYGWSKKEDRITNSLIADKTSLEVKHVSEAVLSLATRRIILIRRIGQTRYISINTDLNKWAYTKPKCKKCAVITAEAKSQDTYKLGIVIPENRDSKNEGETIPENSENYPQKQGLVSPETGNTKDILSNTDLKDNPPFNPPEGKIKFDPLSISIPEWLDSVAWTEWVTYRQKSGKGIKTELTVTKLFRLLKGCLDEGHNPVDVIDSSIANGYQGLFKPKTPTKPVTKQGDLQHANNSGESDAVQRIRAERRRWERERRESSVGALGADGANLREPLDPEERGQANEIMDHTGWKHDLYPDN